METVTEKPSMCIWIYVMMTTSEASQREIEQFRNISGRCESVTLTELMMTGDRGKMAWDMWRVFVLGPALQYEVLCVCEETYLQSIAVLLYIQFPINL